MNASARRTSIAVVAVALIAPAVAFFLSAFGRSLQPTNHEPSRTLDAIVTWFGTLPDVAIVLVLIVLPFVGFVLAAGYLWRTWIADPDIRADTDALVHAAGRVARNISVVFAALVVLFGLLYFAAITIHAVAG